jgi:hypothetical protein
MIYDAKQPSVLPTVSNLHFSNTGVVEQFFLRPVLATFNLVVFLVATLKQAPSAWKYLLLLTSNLPTLTSSLYDHHLCSATADFRGYYY